MTAHSRFTNLIGSAWAAEKMYESETVHAFDGVDLFWDEIFMGQKKIRAPEHSGVRCPRAFGANFNSSRSAGLHVDDR
jgi:hypothetical protein